MHCMGLSLTISIFLKEKKWIIIIPWILLLIG